MFRRSFVLAVVLLTAGGAVLYAVATSGRLHEQARRAVQAAAARQFQRPVQIGALRGDPLRGVVLEGVTVGRREPTAEGAIITAAQIVVSFRPAALLGDLLRRRGVLRSITTITLVRPEIWLEISSAGRWNVLDLVAQPGAPAMKGAGLAPLVVVRDGRVTLTDHSGPPYPFRARFVQVSGRADFRLAPTVELEAALVSLHTGRRTPVTLQGRYLLDRGVLDADLRAEGAPLVQWGPYLVRTPALVFTGGAADAQLHLLRAPWGGRRTLDYRGSVRLVDGAATLLPQRTRLYGMSGLLRVDNDRVATDALSLKVDGSWLRLRGEAALRFGRRLDLVVTSPRLDLAAVQRLLFPTARVRLEGTTGADVRITGSWSAPLIQGTIIRARGAVNRQPVAVESAGLSLLGDLLVLRDVTAVAGDARLQGELRLAMGSGGTLLAAAEVENLPPELLARAGLRLPLSGRLQGSVVLGRAPKALFAEAAGRMGPGQAGGLHVDYLRAGGWYADAEVAFPYLVAGRGKTVLRAAGSVSRRGILDVDAAATGLDLREVARQIGAPPRLQATVEAAGRVTGTRSEPVFNGTVLSGPGTLASLEFDSAQGPLRVSRHALATPGLVLREGRGTYLVSGTVRWKDPSSVALTVQAEGIPAASLIRSAAVPLHLTGRLSGRLTVGGTVTRPLASGRVTLLEGSVQRQRVDEAAATFRWQGGALTLEALRARVGDSVLTARGTVDRTGALSLSFAVRDLDLKHLTALPAEVVQMAGHLDLQGRVEGTAADPAVVAAFSARDLVLNRQPFDRADGVVRWASGRLALEPVTLSQGEGTYTVRGILGLRPPVLDLHGEVSRGSLATLLSLGRLRAPVPLDGRLDGIVTVQGTRARPSAALQARLTRGRLGDQPIDEVDVGLSFRNDVVRVDRLRGRSGEGIFAARGQVVLHGDSQLEVGGTDLNLALLRPLLRPERPLAGTLTFTTQINGRWQDPEVGLSLDVRRGSVNGLRFDSLVANAFYRDGQLHVEQALLSQDGHRVKGVGVIPLGPGRGVLAERPMRFEVSLVQADLSILALLLPPVQESTGRLEGQVLLSGTPGRPVMSGGMTVRDGHIRLRGLNPPLEAVQAGISFSQDRLSLSSFTARLGEGRLEATGSVAIAHFRPDRVERLAVRARDARIEAPPFFTGAVDADLVLTGSLTGAQAPPELTGEVTVKRGDLDALGLLPAPGRQAASRGPDLRLRDLRLTSGEDLTVHLGRMRVELAPGDTLSVGGTLRQPSVTGRLTAQRGAVTVFGRTFTLREGEARFLPQLGMHPLISLDAETDLLLADGSTTKVFLEARQVFPEEIVDRVVLRSDPPHSREQIVGLLAGGAVAEPGADVQALLRAELGRALFGGVEAAIARALGLGEFTVQYDFARPLQLRVGRLLVRDLYLRLTTIFEQETRFVWSLEWRFLRNVMLAFSVDNAGRSGALLQYTLRF
ncbi:MAG: translocation/assembly module TamB domain-containing protein [Armatimonadota bacterium]|nr:translocation/assembly module TamB domain-containing protein [Armatimonadota bacterium]